MKEQRASTRPRPPRQANQRGAARLAAVQALYQMDIAGADVADVLAEFETHRLGREIEGEQYLEADVDFFRGLVTGVLETQRALDPAIHKALTSGWPLARIDATLRAVLRAGTYELMRRPDVPGRVVISEYVDVGRAFFGEGDEPRLINGVLDTLARRYRPGEFGGRG